MGKRFPSSAIKLLSLLFLYFFVKNVTDYKTYLFVTIFSLIGNNIINFLMIKGKIAIIFPTRQLFRHLKPLFYIFSTTIAASMYTILDTVLLGFLSNEKSVGLYTASVKISKVAMPFITSVGVILIPQISKNIAENNRAVVQELLDTSYHFIAFFSIPIVAGLLILAPEFILVFSGEQFIEATLSMQIVSFLPLLIGFGHFFAFQILVPGGKYKQMFISVLGGVFFCFLLNILLVPGFQHDGAAIANIACELIVTISYLYFVKRYFNYTFQWNYLLNAVFCSLCFLPLVIAIRVFSLKPVFTLTVSIVVCAFVYVAFQHFIFKNKFVLKAVNFVQARLWQTKTHD
jgi:O-antigen/teichoic acid export membrane protein